MSSIRKKQFCGYCRTEVVLTAHIPKNIRLHSWRGIHDFIKSQSYFLSSSIFLALHSKRSPQMKGLKSLTSICFTTWQNSYPKAESLHGAVEETGASRLHRGNHCAGMGHYEITSPSAKGLKSLTHVNRMYSSTARTYRALQQM